MPSGGFFTGGDFVPYISGARSYFTSTSAQEFRRHKTIIRPHCRREVPLKDK